MDTDYASFGGEYNYLDPVGVRSIGLTVVFLGGAGVNCGSGSLSHRSARARLLLCEK